MKTRSKALAAAAWLLLAGTGIATASAATVYDAGTAPSAGSSGLTFGNHLMAGETHGSVAGVGGGGISNDGDTLDGNRTYIYDHGGLTDLGDGIANRGDAGFAMMIWDMGTAFDGVRLYTHQDHYSGGPITDSFTAQDVMEYSVWGSTDGDNFVLLSDVTAFDLHGGSGLPTYTFNGAEASVVYRGGSAEHGTLNAYTREYHFGSAYRYFGVRASTISINANDADPELDALAGFNAVTRAVPLPPAAFLAVPLLAGLTVLRRRRREF